MKQCSWVNFYINLLTVLATYSLSRWAVRGPAMEWLWYSGYFARLPYRVPFRRGYRDDCARKMRVMPCEAKRLAACYGIEGYDAWWNGFDRASTLIGLDVGEGDLRRNNHPATIYGRWDSSFDGFVDIAIRGK